MIVDLAVMVIDTVIVAALMIATTFPAGEMRAKYKAVHTADV